MQKENPAKILLQVKTEDGDPDEVDQLTRQLLMELRDEDVESAELVREASQTKGAKSVEAITLGAIVMAVLPKAVPKIIELLQAWIERGTGRRVSFKGNIGGENVEFEGDSKDFKVFLESLENSKK
ncbi:hypothetical protein NC796_17805 [Aliifodinibius sp. S!AR15-10]|uniref:hypothetical protein n=1 Tax=Aliifodinibius sp. S!AR15-10 TaxID=2950437 RepID=UPI00286001E9|nr:hypothetical protein [Aliifodinibius sp. S!AR15-10]MDR8393016.1 hypothetical protein [Aliifodinibius sp. S!AR15-10]